MADQILPDSLCFSRRLMSSWHFPKRSAPGMPPCKGQSCLAGVALLWG